MIPVLYKACFPNGKMYAGITSCGLSARKSGHKSSFLSGVDNKLYRAIKRYGWDSVCWV